MKKFLFYPALFSTVLMIVLAFSYAGAQSESALNTVSASDVQAASENATVAFLVSIPGDFTSRVTWENAADAVYFNFKKSDGTVNFFSR